MEKKLDILAKFTFNQKEYVINLINKEKVLFACVENGEVSFEVTDSEYMIMKKVYKTLLVDEESSIKIFTRKIGQTDYDIFWDRKSNNYFWKNLNNHEENYKDNEILNFMYNHAPLVVYINGEPKEENSKFFNRFVRIGNKLISVLVASGIILNSLTGCSIASVDEIKNSDSGIVNVEENENSRNGYTNEYWMWVDYINDYPNLTEEQKDMIREAGFSELVGEKRVYNFEDIKKAIESNPNLTDSEKEFFYKLQFVFDENNQYMALDLIIDRLETLKIEYYENKNESMAGGYTPADNVIKIYESKSFEDTSIYILTHEILHAFQDHVDYRASLKFFKELSNELLTREVIRKMLELNLIEESKLDKSDLGYSFGCAYDRYMQLNYYWAELLPEETLKKIQFGSRTSSYIVNALYDIIPIDDTYNKFGPPEDWIMNDIEVLFRTHESMTKENRDDIIEQAKNRLNLYYEQKKGCTVDEDLECLITQGNWRKMSSGKYEWVFNENISFDEPLGKVLLGQIESSDDLLQYEDSLSLEWYSLPKTYFSDDHETSKIVYKIVSNENTPEEFDSTLLDNIYEVEVNEELCELYRTYYGEHQKNKEQVKEEEQSKMEEEIDF